MLSHYGVSSLDSLLAFVFSTLDPSEAIPHMHDRHIPPWAIYMSSVERVCGLFGLELDLDAAERSGAIVQGGKAPWHWVAIRREPELPQFGAELPADVICPDPQRALPMTPKLGPCTSPTGVESMWSQLNRETVSIHRARYPGCGPLCKLTGNPIRQPVVASDGYTYEKSAILRHIYDCKQRCMVPTSPVTQEEILEVVFNNFVLL